jgi:type I restriction enzyme S subunit
MDEQQQIVDYISSEIEKMDRLISLASRAIERLEEHRAALITAGVTGKIDLRGETPAVIEAAE